MDNAVYAMLGRQTGLLREMDHVANNIANASTSGFRREGVIFSEHVRGLGPDSPSLSMAIADGRIVDLAQAPVSRTGNAFDLAIQGEGFFLIETPQGNQLTRAGAFTLSPEGELVTADGFRLLDAGGAPVSLGTDPSGVSIAADGTVSRAGSQMTQIGLWAPPPGESLIHVAGTRFASSGEAEPLASGVMMQGFLESSNVNPVTEIARMIEVQRAYELGQDLLTREDDRIRKVIQTFAS